MSHADLQSFLEKTRSNRQALIRLAKEYIASHENLKKSSKSASYNYNKKNYRNLSLERSKEPKSYEVYMFPIHENKKSLTPVHKRSNIEKVFLTPKLKMKVDKLDSIYSQLIPRRRSDASFRLNEIRVKYCDKPENYISNRSKSPEENESFKSKVIGSLVSHKSSDDFTRSFDPLLCIHQRRLKIKEKILMKSPSSMSHIRPY